MCLPDIPDKRPGNSHLASCCCKQFCRISRLCGCNVCESSAYWCMHKVQKLQLYLRDGSGRLIAPSAACCWFCSLRAVLHHSLRHSKLLLRPACEAVPCPCSAAAVRQGVAISCNNTHRASNARSLYRQQPLTTLQAYLSVARCLFTPLHCTVQAQHTHGSPILCRNEVKGAFLCRCTSTEGESLCCQTLPNRRTTHMQLSTSHISSGS